MITSRTAVYARVFVTDRMRPLRVEDHVVHQIWMPYHWGHTRSRRRRRGERPARGGRRPERVHPGEQGRHVRHSTWAAASRSRAVWSTSPSTATGRASLQDGHRHPGHERQDDELNAIGTTLTTTTVVGRLTIWPATRATASIRSGWDSSPTRRCASGARHARWRARSGTGCPTTGSTCWGCRSTTPECWGRTRGGMSRSSSSAPTQRNEHADESDGSTAPRGCLDVCPTGALFRTEFSTVVRPVLKPPMWDWKIAAYLFSGGLSAGSALLAAGADITDRPQTAPGGKAGGAGRF